MISKLVNDAIPIGLGILGYTYEEEAKHPFSIFRNLMPQSFDDCLTTQQDGYTPGGMPMTLYLDEQYDYWKWTFRKEENGPRWKKLLTGKCTHFGSERHKTSDCHGFAPGQKIHLV